MAVLAFDLETTGLDFGKDKIIEIGALLVSNDLKFFYGSMNEVISGSVVSNEIYKITGISQSEVDAGISMDAAMMQLNTLLGTQVVDFVIAYNADFDKQMLMAEIIRGGWDKYPNIAKLRVTPWLCAMRDVEDNQNYKCLKLSHLALDKGITVNPRLLHRAMDDVRLMIDMLRESKIKSIYDVFDYQNEPWIFIEAVCKPPWEDNGVSTTHAKKLGFTFEKVNGSDEKFPKKWIKRIKQKDADKFFAEASIKVKEIQCN